VAIVTTASGLPVSGVLVAFSVISGPATLSATQITTGANGTAQVTATPAAAGTVTISASVAGLGVAAIFNETGLPTPVAAQLLVLPAALTFAAVQGGDNPPPANIAISNTGSGTLQWSASANANPTWLTMGATSGTTPAVLVGSTNTAGLAAGLYQSAITLTSGNLNQTIPVTLTVAAPGAAQFKLTPAALVVNAAAGSTTPISRSIEVANLGTGAIPWTAAAGAGSPWLSILSPPSGTEPSTVMVQLDASGLPAGQYLGNIAFSSPGLAPANVAVMLNLSALPDLISTVPLLEFSGAKGSSFALQSLPVTTSFGTTVSFTATATLTSGMHWLNLSGASGGSPASISVSVNTDGLAAGYYVGYISVQSAGAGNTLLVPVVLDLGSAAAVGMLSASPGGVLLTGAASSSPGAALTQTIAISSDTESFSWNAAALAGSGGAWLAVSPASGTGNGSVTLSANLAGLQPGSYSGQVAISATGTSNAQLIIPVTLIVTNGATSATAVTPANTLQPIQPVGDFIASVGVPVALQVSILSPTGTPVTGTVVQVAFTTGDAPAMLMDVGGGTYTGVWTPVQTGPVSLLFSSLNAPMGFVTGVITASALNRPIFTGRGLVGGASFVSGMPLGIGSISALFGHNLAAQADKAASFPLPLTLGGTSVTINGIVTPLFYVSPAQINFFVPYELAGQTTATIVVSVATGVAEVSGVPIAPESPGLFLTDAIGDAALHLNGQPVSVAAPATGGELVEIFATGLGPVSNAPADGAAAPTNPLAMDQITPLVTIGGVNAKVPFAGLAPGFAGLYQINVVVPVGLPSGAATLTIAAESLFANNAILQLQ
jgi:adhesin/invasin